jgi:hypothetical protein
MIDFYPKYHCEFNFVEVFWGPQKHGAKQNCTFNFNDHLELVPKALDSVSICKIRKFVRKSYRYVDAYCIKSSDGKSSSTQMVKYAVKKYRGHRKNSFSHFKK